MLEVCCGSYYDALQASQGGAGRIELNCGLHLGGLTPSLASLELVKEHCELPVVAMVRPRGGGFCYGEEDYEVMLRECTALLAHGADGIAFGCLRPDAGIDKERNARLIDKIHSQGKEAVFHRAYDCTGNPFEAMEVLISLGVDRVLTSGLKPTAMAGKELLKKLQETYGNQIQILAGSGVDACNARQLMAETGIRQVHSSCKNWVNDPTTTANEVSFSFADVPNENSYEVVSAKMVRQLLESMETLSL